MLVQETQTWFFFFLPGYEKCEKKLLEPAREESYFKFHDPLVLNQGCTSDSSRELFIIIELSHIPQDYSLAGLGQTCTSVCERPRGGFHTNPQMRSALKACSLRTILSITFLRIYVWFFKKKIISRNKEDSLYSLELITA